MKKDKSTWSLFWNKGGSNQEAWLDIVNRRDWDDAKRLSFFRERLYDMKAKRTDYNAKWDNIDNSVTWVSFYNNDWELEVIIPLEKTLIEIYEWRTKGLINYDIKADWQTDINQLQPAKYALQFFLDWHDDENFWEENKKLKSLKAKYWNWIFFTWMRSRKEYRYRVKDDAEIEDGTDILEQSNFEQYTHEDWHFFPKNIHVRDFWIDDKALWQPSIQYADDCIYKEKISLTELELRYKGKKSIDQKELDQVSYRVDPEPKNKKDQSINRYEVIIYHYYNKATKTYMIVANEQQVLYRWIYLYDDGKLPFENIQHYYDPDSFYTDGIAWRCAYLKAYKSEIFQNILTGSAMASWVNIIAWNDDQVWQDWTVWGRQLNVWRTTWGADNVKQISATPNLWFFTVVMDLIDKETAIVTWINPSEQIDATSDVLGIVEINEANKAVRTGSVDECYEIWLDNTLTMTLARIKQFAPSLLSVKKYWEWEDWKKWELLKVIPIKISIKNAKIRKRKWQIVVEEDMWKYWYFDLTEDVLQWRWVKITTSSTSSVLPILERKKIDWFIANLLTLAQVAQIDQSGEAMESLKKFMRFDQILEWLTDWYEYDQENLKSNTQKDDIRHTNIDKLKKLEEMLTLNQKNNENNQMATGGAEMWGQANPSMWGNNAMWGSEAIKA